MFWGGVTGKKVKFVPFSLETELLMAILEALVRLIVEPIFVMQC